MRARALVVEDNRALAENIAELLEQSGVEVTIASSAGEAVQAALAGPLDLAIVDVRLPGGQTGLDLVPRLRQRSEDTEVILVTGNATLDSAIAAVRHGVFAYVQKPFDPDDFVALAERALSQVRLKRERAALEQRAAEAEAMAAMGRLTAALAHEIRNPLNAAMLQLELMERAARRSEDPAIEKGVADRVRVVKGDLARLSRLLDDFLGLARPTRVENEAVEVARMVGDVSALQEPLAKEHGVALHVSIAPDLPPMRCNEGRVKQVLVNLVVNAIDALRGQPRPGGTVTLVAIRDGDMIELRVEDDGPGVRPDLRDRLFRPFVTGKAHGTGLGLAIVQKLVELHGGTVALEDRQGGGTVARVRMPIAEGVGASEDVRG